MAKESESKTINVYLKGSGSEPVPIVLATKGDFEVFTNAEGILYFVTMNGKRRYSFGLLDDGGTYNVGYKKTESQEASPKRTKTIEDVIKEIQFKHPKPPRLSRTLIARDDAKSKVFSYLKNCRNRSEDVLDNAGKFSLFGTTGVKGIGKTEIMGRICDSWANEALGNAQALYVTYNGRGVAGDFCLNPDGKKVQYGDAFGYLLLHACGVPKETAVEVAFDKAIEYVYDRFCNDGEPLVICVDEIIELNRGIEYKPNEWSPAAHTMSALMKMQDHAEGRLIFAFTGILDSMFTILKSLSGRSVIPLPLTLIPLSAVFSNLLSSNGVLGRLRPFMNEPAVNQLIVSCAGHPRATVEGLDKHSKNWTQQEGVTASNITTSEILTARSAIVNQTCKFDLTYLSEDILRQWFDCFKPISFEMRERFLSQGILHSITNGTEKVEFLFPLLLQDWAVNNQSSTFGFHLHGLFNADLPLNADNEKSVEAVMYHYEALLRKATAGKTFSVTDFYETPHVADPLAYKRLQSIIVENSVSCVAYVDDFTDTNYIIKQLKNGYIVVSRKHAEVGVEYLVPYLSDGNLCVACVQCKFVHTSTNFADIKKKMLTAIDGLKSKNVDCFPVVYTTVDQARLFKSTYGDGVYFVEADLYNFTKRMGILRMHTMKLGDKLLSCRPYLRTTA